MQVIRFTSPPFGILTPHKLSIQLERRRNA